MMKFKLFLNLKKIQNLSQNKVDIKNKTLQNHPIDILKLVLIKKLEELGIGRPSTYVSIFTKLEDRNYITIKNKSLIPTSKRKNIIKIFR